ncbi:T9SS C-terminal target domain-containing protein [Lutibacter sp. HS1-25]|uniref:T9SS type A sorting domain-containing protein n=1 Tax=Lutibacter sp. HS1-25 TaxID=2485000 RepID=UPI00101364C6|nr:T9SS type A sorting domain-containing protein [Lutibacter sp. HS1-25]RXP46221.1 T9SS C-terminal target domain-containing protein [Lutibacter sp. HS1-25]
MNRKLHVRFFLIIVALFYSKSFFGQNFEIIADNVSKRRAITDTIQSGNFTLGVNSNGGGYITEVSIPGIGNTMGIQAQRYGRGGQSSIRDLSRGGQYNPTQAGFSDEGGTVCEVVKTNGKIVVPSRGCALYNGDGQFDYTRWENIVSDHPNIVDNNNDQDNIEEENLSVTINGITYTQQAAEVYSDFDFYCEYENIKNTANLSIPAIRHYLEYRFVRSSTLPNSPMNQFNIPALTAVGKWSPDKLPTDISTQFPEGIYPGSTTNLNYVSYSWSIRTDVAIWNPIYRYAQKNDNSWEIVQRQGTFNGDISNYKLRFIVADSNNENSGHALGFYLPDTTINTFDVVGINESDGSEAYSDDRTTENFYLDIPYRTPSMSWIGFRKRFKGLIDKSILSATNPGVYEKFRQESILLYGTPAQIKTAFTQLDTYYQTLSNPEFTLKDSSQFEMYPNPTNTDIHLKLNSNESKIEVFNLLGVKIYEALEFSNQTKIPIHQFKETGLYFVRVNNTLKKLVIY